MKMLMNNGKISNPVFALSVVCLHINPYMAFSKILFADNAFAKNSKE